MAPHAPGTNHRLKSESIMLRCQLCSTCYTALQINTNQELFEKHLCNQSSHYEKYRQFPLHRETMHHALLKLTPFAVTGKSMKNALYILWYYAKRNVSC